MVKKMKVKLVPMRFGERFTIKLKQKMEKRIKELRKASEGSSINPSEESIKANTA